MAKKLNNVVENDIKKIDEIKEEVLNYSKERIDIEVQNSFKKLEKKLLKSKNIKIIKRDIVIVILLSIIGFMSYIMYKNGDFDKYIKHKEEVIYKIKEEDKTTTEEEPEIKEPEKDLSIHNKALDNYYIDINSNYLNDYYTGNITNELLLSLTINNISLEDITEDEEIYFIDSNLLEEKYNSLFDSIDYNNISFKYNNNSIKYIKANNQYMSNNKIDISKESNIKRLINKVTEEDNIITIYTTEYIIKNNKIINILTKKEIDTYKDEKSITKNAKSLNQLKYTFTYNDGTYKLINIETTK